MLLAIMFGFGLLGLALVGPALFMLVIKGMASVLGTMAYQLFGYRPPAVALRFASMACILTLLVLLPIKGCNHWQVELYRKAIPPQFELGEIVYHDERSDLREGCGVAIFRLSEESLARIHREGLTYLESARLGRDGVPYHQYQSWKATPAAKEENLFRGAHCVEEEHELLKHAQRFRRKEGAFFTTGPEQDLVLIPSLGVLIFSHNG